MSNDPQMYVLALSPGQDVFTGFTWDMQYLEKLSFAVQSEYGAVLEVFGSDDPDSEFRPVLYAQGDRSVSIMIYDHNMPRFVYPVAHRTVVKDEDGNALAAKWSLCVAPTYREGAVNLDLAELEEMMP